jgi:hypothetical protein
VHIFSWPVVIATVAVLIVGVVSYRREVASRRAQSTAARSFIASRGRPVEGWPAVWAWSPSESPAPVPGAPAGTGMADQGTSRVVVGGAS